jgi:hypothetical protein
MSRNFVFSILALFSMQNLVSAEHAPVRATCDISCTVEDIVEWSDDSFPAINLGNLTNENREVSGSASLLLYTNKDVQIIADNSYAARLSKDGAHTLVTQYNLEYYGTGADQTGGSSSRCSAAGTAGWSDYDCFLVNGSQVTHFPGDGAVEVILSVRAFKNTAPADSGYGSAFSLGRSPAQHSAETTESGYYTARQTLTVCWK